MAGSNNYLGLTADPRVKEAAVQAIKKYGTGCSGSRYLTGTLDLHIEAGIPSRGVLRPRGVPPLQHRISDGPGDSSRPSCRRGTTSFLTATITHGIVAGNLMAKGAFADFVRYKHNDMEDLEKVLTKLPAEAAKLIVSDGVFSTTV